MILFIQSMLTGSTVELKDVNQYRYDVQIRSIERLGHDSFMCEGEWRGFPGQQPFEKPYRCEVLVVQIGSNHSYELQWIS